MDENLELSRAPQTSAQGVQIDNPETSVRKQNRRRASVVAAEPANSPDRDGRNIGITALLQTCRERAEAAFGQREGANNALYDALASTFELHQLSQESEDNAAELEKEFREREIRQTKRTDIFTRLVKLVFANSNERSNINRYAGTLRLALSNNTKPDELAEFIKGKGGIAKCAVLEARTRRASSGDDNGSLEQRRAAAVAISLGEIPDLPSDGAFTLLVEPTDDGKYLVLGTRRETEKGVGRFLSQLSKSRSSRRKSAQGKLNNGFLPIDFEPLREQDGHLV